MRNVAEPDKNGVPLRLIGKARPMSSRVIPPDPVRTWVIDTCISELHKVPTEHLIAWLPIFGKYAINEDDDG